METIKFKKWDCYLKFGEYGNGRLAIQLMDVEDGCPVATATVNLPHEHLGEGEIFIKDYSENEGVLQTLIDEGLVEDTGETIEQGFVEINKAVMTPKLINLLEV